MADYYKLKSPEDVAELPVNTAVAWALVRMRETFEVLLARRDREEAAGILREILRRTCVNNSFFADNMDDYTDGLKEALADIHKQEPVFIDGLDNPDPEED